MRKVTRRYATQVPGGAAAGLTMEATPGNCAISPRPANQPNIILIVVDDLRSDEFGPAGHPYLKTPNLIDRPEYGRTLTELKAALAGQVLFALGLDAAAAEP